MLRYRASIAAAAGVAVLLLAGSACGRTAVPEPAEGTYETRTATLTIDGSDHDVEVASVDDGFFTMQVALGRVFAADEYTAGGDPVAVLQYGFWEDAFHGSPNIVGSEVQIDGVTHRILGVMPRGFDFPAGVSAWVPRVK